MLNEKKLNVGDVYRCIISTQKSELIDYLNIVNGKFNSYMMYLETLFDGVIWTDKQRDGVTDDEVALHNEISSILESLRIKIHALDEGVFLE